MQADPPSPPAPGPINVHVDLSALANLIWQSFIDHIGDVGGVIWQGIRDHMGEIGTAIWTPLASTLTRALREAAMALWNATFGAIGSFLGTVQPDLTYNLPAYRAIATDPVPVAVGGATLALVLLGLRTLFGAMIGRDHVITHISGRLIPAVFLCLAYPVLIVQGAGLLNAAAVAIGTNAAVGALVAFNESPGDALTALTIPYMFLWVVLIYYGVRLLLRVAYSIFRLLVALVFGPVAIILWAIPQTEWVTMFWLRELVGWATTPLLVTVCLALAIPLASAHSGFLASIAFGIAGFQAAHDLAGLLAHSAGGKSLSPIGYIRMAASAASGGGAGVATASIPANRVTTLAEQYGYD